MPVLSTGGAYLGNILVFGDCAPRKWFLLATGRGRVTHLAWQKGAGC